MPPKREHVSRDMRASSPALPAVAGVDASRVRRLGDGTFPPGCRVLHATFGEGKVTHSEGEGPKQKLTVIFPTLGQKVIVARFVEPLG